MGTSAGLARLDVLLAPPPLNTTNSKKETWTKEARLIGFRNLFAEFLIFSPKVTSAPKAFRAPDVTKGPGALGGPWGHRGPNVATT